MKVLQFSIFLSIMVMLSVAFESGSSAAPVVTSTIPSSGATNVPINIPITAVFSEAMNDATINYSTFTLEKLVPGTLTLNIKETNGTTTTYSGNYTTEPFAGIYSGTFGGSISGNFYTGLTGDRFIEGFSYSSTTAEYFFTSILDVNPTTWSFDTYSSESTHFWGNLTASSISGSWYNSGYSGSFSGTKQLGIGSSAGYNKDVYTNSSFDPYPGWIAAAEVSNGVITGYVISLGTPDVFYGTGTVSADNKISIPNIYSGRGKAIVASATGTLNPAGEPVTGSVSYDASTHSATLTHYSVLDANSTYRATISGSVTNAPGTPMGKDKVWTFTTGTLTAKELSVAISGSGNGHLSSTPPGIDCSYSPQSGFCSAWFTNSPVSLTATANSDSVFSSWGDDCSSCSTSPCTVTLSASKSCIAGFAAKMVIIDGNINNGYATLQKAYDTAGDNALLMVRSGTLSENVVLDDGKSVKISGGYNSSFSSQTGATEIDGSLTVARGSLTVEGITII
jgi:hypothetical protein